MVIVMMVVGYLRNSLIIFAVTLFPRYNLVRVHDLVRLIRFLCGFGIG